MKSSKSMQVELGEVEGFWSVMQLLQQTLAKYLNVESKLIGCWYEKKPISCAMCHYVRLS